MVFRCTPMLMTCSFTSMIKLSCDRRLLSFTECISETENWMTSNQLNMNSDKTDFNWLGSKQQLAKTQCQSICLNGVHIPVSTEVTCLGFWLDSQLTFTPHVQLLARRCFYYLQQIRTVRRSLNTESAKALVYALTASRLDYCNSVLYRINTSAAKTLQPVLHLAA